MNHLLTLKLFVEMIGRRKGRKANVRCEATGSKSKAAITKRPEVKIDADADELATPLLFCEPMPMYEEVPSEYGVISIKATPELSIEATPSPAAGRQAGDPPIPSHTVERDDDELAQPLILYEVMPMHDEHILPPFCEDDDLVLPLLFCEPMPMHEEVPSEYGVISIEATPELSIEATPMPERKASDAMTSHTVVTIDDDQMALPPFCEDDELMPMDEEVPYEYGVISIEATSEPSCDVSCDEYSSLLELFEKETYKEQLDINAPLLKCEGCDLSSDESDDSVTDADNMPGYEEDFVVPDDADPVVYRKRRRWAVAADRDLLKLKLKIEKKVLSINREKVSHASDEELSSKDRHGTIVLATFFGNRVDGTNSSLIIAGDTKESCVDGSKPTFARKVHKIDNHILAGAGPARLVLLALKQYRKREAERRTVKEGAILIIGCLRHYASGAIPLYRVNPDHVSIFVAGITKGKPELYEVLKYDNREDFVIMKRRNFASMGGGSAYVDHIFNGNMRRGTLAEVSRVLKRCFKEACKKDDEHCGGSLDVALIADGRVGEIRRGMAKEKKKKKEADVK